MKLPFGLDLWSVIVGMLLVWFVLPFVLKFFNKPSQSKTTA